MGKRPYQTKYESIPLPEELGTVVEQALRRGRRRRLVGRTVSGLAAMLAVVFLTANVPMLYAGAAELPLLGPMVRIMRVGSGGQAAVSGVTGTVRTGEDAVQISFAAPDGSGTIPVFSAVRREAPRRLVLRLHGIAELDIETLAEALRRQAAVADAYPLAVTDPEERGITLLLRAGYDCSVGEYGAPDTLGICFSPGEPAEPDTIWYLHSAPMPFGPELAELTERLSWEGAAQVRTTDGEYLVTLGAYSTEKRAEQAQKGIWQKTGVELEIAGGTAFEIPAGQ